MVGRHAAGADADEQRAAQRHARPRHGLGRGDHAGAVALGVRGAEARRPRSRSNVASARMSGRSSGPTQGSPPPRRPRSGCRSVRTAGGRDRRRSRRAVRRRCPGVRRSAGSARLKPAPSRTPARNSASCPLLPGRARDRRSCSRRSRAASPRRSASTPSRPRPAAPSLSGSGSTCSVSGTNEPTLLLAAQGGRWPRRAKASRCGGSRPLSGLVPLAHLVSRRRGSAMMVQRRRSEDRSRWLARLEGQAQAEERRRAAGDGSVRDWKLG